MYLEIFISQARPKIETGLQHYIDSNCPVDLAEVKSMLRYHMGWEGEGCGPEAQGKRIRPILVLLCAESAGGKIENALPAASAVELLHNFSLIHDDIQDKSDLRRGRYTVWKKWGIAQAINAGDLMFTIAFLAMLDLKSLNNSEVVLGASELLQRACVELTCGQYLDLNFETNDDITLDEYIRMIGGKTAALLGCCTEIGALIGGADKVHRIEYRDFGRSLGLAFQVWDDWLGIWGDSALTGKSTESDLICRKKTIPVLYGLEKKGLFLNKWKKGEFSANEVEELSILLQEEGAQDYTEKMAKKFTDEAMVHLRNAAGESDSAKALEKLAGILLKRQN